MNRFSTLEGVAEAAPTPRRPLFFAPRSAAGSDLVLQLQVIRDQQPVITKPVEKIDTTQATDPASIPYGEELSLAGLPAGNYLLTITIIDRASKSSARQQAKFVIY